MEHLPVDHPVEEGRNLTWDEFLALPYETRNASLIDGEVVVNAPNAQHELVVQKLTLAFWAWMRDGADRGEVSTQQPVKINDRRGYQPDFAWYPQDRCAPRDEPPSFSGLPCLIVEILSPSTRTFDLLRKRADYDNIGIDEVWFVDGLERSVLLCQRSEPGLRYHDEEVGTDGILTSPLLEGFEVPVSELFER